MRTSIVVYGAQLPQDTVIYIKKYIFNFFMFARGDATVKKKYMFICFSIITPNTI